MSIPEIATSANGVLKRHAAALIWFGFFSVGSLCASIMTALAGTNWTTCDSQTRFLIVVSIVGSWTTTVGALFKNTAKKEATLVTIEEEAR